MPQPVTLKKLRLNGSMKTYKTFKTNAQKRCPFHYSGLECKNRKSRNTWSNRQIWPWSTEWSRAKAEFCQENTLVIANTLFQQHKRRLYTWASLDALKSGHLNQATLKSDWLYSLQPKMEKRSSIQLAKTKPGADCGSDHEPLIAKFRLNLKK